MARARPPAKRSARKQQAHKAGRPYPDDVKAGALTRLEQGASLAAVHADTGIPKPTLSRWAKTAGIDLDEATRARTAAATAGRIEQLATLELRTVHDLEQILARQLVTLGRLADLETDALVKMHARRDVKWLSTMGGPVAELVDREARDAAGLAKAARDTVSKRDVVGAVGLLVDKLELLAGKATERGELVVRFGIPRPDFAAADRDAIDLDPGADS